MFRLELIQYFFTEINCEANEDHMAAAKTGDRQTPDYNLEASSHVSYRDGKMMINLKIVYDDESENDPYGFTISVFGVFQVIEDEQEAKGLTKQQFPENIRKLMAQSAVQILTGAARDMLHTMTSKGPFPTQPLPMFYLNPEDIEEHDADESE